MDSDKDKLERLYAIKRGAHPAALRVGESAHTPASFATAGYGVPAWEMTPTPSNRSARPASSGRPSQSHQSATFSSALGIGADTVL